MRSVVVCVCAFVPLIGCVDMCTINMCVVIVPHTQLSSLYVPQSLCSPHTHTHTLANWQFIFVKAMHKFMCGDGVAE